MPETWKSLIGQVVNKEFRLDEYLGGSDHSAVFLTQRSAGKPEKAAIKIISADLQNAESQLARWEAARKLSHPHLLRLFETGRCELQGTHFLYVVMECAEEDLSQILPQRPLTPGEARDMLQPVLSVLAYIHRQGLVHGGLKPANVMASGDHLKLSSDGLYKMGESPRRSAERGIYEAPEVAKSGMSPASDIWSLGITLAEVMTQHPPVLKGETDPTPPQMPDPFIKIARECLRREPTQRCSIAGILGLLQPARPISVRQAPSTPVFSSPDTPSPRRFVVPALATGVVIAALVAGPKLFHHSSRTAPKVVAQATQPSTVSKQTPPALQEKPPALTRRESSAAAPDQAEPAGEQTHSATIAPTSYGSESKPKPPEGQFVPGDVVEKVLPHVPQQARDTIHGTVRVAIRVHVDRTGRVAAMKFDSAGPSKYFARLAMDAARRWRFDPPTVDGQDVASDWVLRFEFTQLTTRVIPVSHSPA